MNTKHITPTHSAFQLHPLKIINRKQALPKIIPSLPPLVFFTNGFHIPKEILNVQRILQLAITWVFAALFLFTGSVALLKQAL
jgi:hypothetical protein